MSYALNLGSVKTTDEGRRILSATFDEFGAPGQPRVAELPQGDISDYLYSVSGEYVSDPLPDPEPPAPSTSELMDAQTMYTALMTDTLIGEIDKVDTLKAMYKRGSISQKTLEDLLSEGKITQDEYNEIIAGE